ncbi:hypothetical protein ACRCQW_26470, partial [Pseudomonas aeruginosa]
MSAITRYLAMLRLFGMLLCAAAIPSVAPPPRGGGRRGPPPGPAPPDLAMAFYNPISRARPWQLGRALEIV